MNKGNVKQKIGPLKKVVLSVDVFDATQRNQFDIGAFQLQFIYGTATEGLSDFEIKIAEYMEGDCIDIDVKRINLPEFWGVLWPKIAELIDLSENISELHFNLKIVQIQTPSDREIIQAMAGGSSCGCSGDCGCGCH